MQSIILPSNVDIETFESKISYGIPKSLDNGGKVIYMYYDKKPLIIQTPEMVAPFGLSKWSADNSSNEKYSIDLSFKDKENRKSVKAFYDILTIIDKKMIKDGLENSMSWFKKKITTEAVVDALYTPQIKSPKDKSTGEITDKYPSTFRVALPYRDNIFQCKVFKEKEEIDLNSIETKGSKVTAIMQCAGIWVAGGKFGCSWKALQVRVVPSETFTGYAFQEEANLIESDNDEDNDEIEHYNNCRSTKEADVEEEEKVEVEEEKVDVKEEKVEVEEEKVKEEKVEVQVAKKIIRRKNKDNATDNTE